MTKRGKTGVEWRFSKNAFFFQSRNKAFLGGNLLALKFDTLVSLMSAIKAEGCFRSAESVEMPIERWQGT